MTSQESLYNELEVTRDASQDDIKKAFRKLALQWHPDKNSAPEANERFKKITHAYEILSDPHKRKVYDQQGEAGLQGENYEPHDASSIFEEFFNGFGGFHFGGLFGSRGPRVFNFSTGSSSRKQRKRKGQTLSYELKVTLKELYMGNKRKLKVSRQKTCAECKGSGLKASENESNRNRNTTCRSCRGAGVVLLTRRSGIVMIQQQETCKDCRGTGEFIKPSHRCSVCNGDKMVSCAETVEVDLTGKDFDEEITFVGLGDETVEEGESGDLVIYLREKEETEAAAAPEEDSKKRRKKQRRAGKAKVEAVDKFFKRGFDLCCSKKISLVDALVSDRTTITTLDGRVLNVLFDKQKGVIKPGDVKMIYGEGMILPSQNNHHQNTDQRKRGDLFILFDVEFPLELDLEQKQKLREVLSPHTSSYSFSSSTTSTTTTTTSPIQIDGSSSAIPAPPPQHEVIVLDSSSSDIGGEETTETTYKTPALDVASYSVDKDLANELTKFYRTSQGV